MTDNSNPTPVSSSRADVLKVLKPFADEADRLEKLSVLKTDLVLSGIGNVLTSDFIRAREVYESLSATTTEGE